MARSKSTGRALRKGLRRVRFGKKGKPVVVGPGRRYEDGSKVTGKSVAGGGKGPRTKNPVGRTRPITALDRDALGLSPVQPRSFPTRPRVGGGSTPPRPTKRPVTAGGRGLTQRPDVATPPRPTKRPVTAGGRARSVGSKLKATPRASARARQVASPNARFNRVTGGKGQVAPTPRPKQSATPKAQTLIGKAPAGSIQRLTRSQAPVAGGRYGQPSKARRLPSTKLPLPRLSRRAKGL